MNKKNSIQNMYRKPVDKKQNKQIAALQKKVALLASMANVPKKSRKRVLKRNLVTRNNHPLMPQIKGLVNPFAAVPGTAQHLIDVVPSVKYTIKGRSTVTIPVNSDMQIFVAPTVAYDITDSAYRPSAVCLVSTGGSQYGYPLLESTQVGTDWKPTSSTGSLIIPNRPYFVQTNNLDSYRLVSYAIRIRYTGTVYNANGTLKCLAAPHGELSIDDLPTMQSVINELQSSVQTAYKSIYNEAVYEFNFIGDDEWHERQDSSDGYACAL
jgi:hypothetical protein